MTVKPLKNNDCKGCQGDKWGLSARLYDPCMAVPIASARENEHDANGPVVMAEDDDIGEPIEIRVLSYPISLR